MHGLRNGVTQRLAEAIESYIRLTPSERLALVHSRKRLPTSFWFASRVLFFSLFIFLNIPYEPFVIFAALGGGLCVSILIETMKYAYTI
jgi:hypothetical protein